MNVSSPKGRRRNGAVVAVDVAGISETLVAAAAVAIG